VPPVIPVGIIAARLVLLLGPQYPIGAGRAGEPAVSGPDACALAATAGAEAGPNLVVGLLHQVSFLAAVF
jgi:hypothetical protein